MLRPARHGEFEPASRLCRELMERGGLYSSFATFLRWRSDILPRGWIAGFRKAREREAASRTEAAAILQKELGAHGAELVAHLEAEPCWSTRARWAFRSQFETRAVVVEFAREPVSESEFRLFTRELSKLSDAAPVCSSNLLEQFQEWLHLADGLERERAYLEAANAFREHTSFLFPAIVPAVCSARVLCFTWMEGSSASSRILAGDANVASQLTELVLEQPAVLGMIDADLDLENIVVDGGGRLAVRHWDRLVAVPLGFRNAVLRYLCGVMSGESPRAVRMLVRLALGYHSEAATDNLREALTRREPDLNGELRLPISAAMFENYWRAISIVSPTRPLYLDCLHRNLQVVAYCCAEAASEVVGGDPLAEAQFAVLGRLVRKRGADLSRTESVSGLAMESAMLPLKVLRDLVRLGERFVDNQRETEFNSIFSSDATRQNRRVCSLIFAGLLAAMFLVCTHLGKAAPAPWSWWLPVAAAAAFVSLIGVVVRLD